MGYLNRIVTKLVTIPALGTQSPAGAGAGALDTDGLDIVGVICPPDLNGAVLLTFLTANGKDPLGSNNSVPDNISQYRALEDDAGLAQSVTIADDATRTFGPTLAALFMGVPRYVVIEVDDAVTNATTFGIQLRNFGPERPGSSR